MAEWQTRLFKGQVGNRVGSTPTARTNNPGACGSSKSLGFFIGKLQKKELLDIEIALFCAIE